MINNNVIAKLLRCVAASYTLSEINYFRITAYEKAADTIEHLNREIYDIWQNGELDKIPGIGINISKHLNEYFNNPKKNYLTKIINIYNPALYELLDIPGIGIKKSYKLCMKLNLNNPKTVVDDLYQACQDNKVAGLENFGLKSQNEIAKSIEIYKNNISKPKRMLLSQAYEIAANITDYIKKNQHVDKIDWLGSLRRGVYTIGDIDIAIVAPKKHAKEIIDYICQYEFISKVEVKGEKKLSILITGGKRIDIIIADSDSYGAMLQYFTGSKLHNIELRKYAIKKGYSLSEYGIKSISKSKKEKIFQFNTEKEFYNFLGIQYIPPEIREGTSEINLASKHKIPELVKLTDIKSDLQIHSDYNLEPSHDLGLSSTEEIIKQAKNLKLEYIAITDHNPSVSRHSEQQIADIMKKRYAFFKHYQNKFPIIISCETDIMPDGKLALPREAFDYVDMLIIAIHSSFKQDKQQMTNRILKALSNYKVKIFAHPTCREINKREEIEADWDAIFNFCSQKNIALEINSWPKRLDLPDILVRRAKNYNCLFSIGTDSHKANDMENIKYGITVARRGWLTKSEIINTKNYQDLLKWINL